MHEDGLGRSGAFDVCAAGCAVISAIRSLRRSVWSGELHLVRAGAAPAVPSREQNVRDVPPNAVHLTAAALGILLVVRRFLRSVIFLPAINLDSNSPVRFHKTMNTKATGKTNRARTYARPIVE